MIEVSADNKTESARIMVVGVGGGGNNAVNLSLIHISEPTRH